MDFPRKGPVMRKEFWFVHEQGSIGDDISYVWPMYQVVEQAELTQYDILTPYDILHHAHHSSR